MKNSAQQAGSNTRTDIDRKDTARHPEPTSSHPSSQPVSVDTVICDRTADPHVRLTLEAIAQGQVVLSLAQARALSLALIAAVNKHEQHAHARHKHAAQPRARLSVLQPAER